MDNENEGMIIWTNGDRYRGEIKNQNPNGVGKMEFSNGN